ncbi:MAG: acetyltransferase [Pseudomonadota bacterium]
MKRLVIIGTGGLANVAYEYFSHDSDYTVAGFSVDGKYIEESTQSGLPVVPFDEIDRAFPPIDHACHVAVGSNWLRERFMTSARQLGYELASYVSSHAFVWRNVPVGANALIMEMNVVQPGASIGDGVVLSSGNHVGHDAKVDDLCFLASGVVLAGRSKLGRRTFVGINASVADDIEIAPDAYVAMGAAVNKTFDERGQILIGNPAVASKVSTYSYFGVDP